MGEEEDADLVGFLLGGGHLARDWVGVLVLE